MRDMKSDMDRQVAANKTTMDQFMRMQTLHTENEADTKEREAKLLEGLNQECAFQEMKFDEERKIALEMQREADQRAMELRKANANMSMLRVVSAAGLAAVGALTSNPTIGAAGLRVAVHGMTNQSQLR